MGGSAVCGGSPPVMNHPAILSHNIKNQYFLYFSFTFLVFLLMGQATPVVHNAEGGWVLGQRGPRLLKKCSPTLGGWVMGACRIPPPLEVGQSL